MDAKYRGLWQFATNYLAALGLIALLTLLTDALLIGQPWPQAIWLTGASLTLGSLWPMISPAARMGSDDDGTIAFWLAMQTAVWIGRAAKYTLRWAAAGLALNCLLRLADHIH